MARLALVANLATCISDLLQIDSKFCHQAMSLALLGSKVGHQVVSLALPHCNGMPYWHYQLVLSLYLHQPESHQFSLQKGLGLSESVSENRTHRSDPMYTSGMDAPPRPAEKQAAPPRPAKSRPCPAPPNKIDEIRGAQRGKTDCRFH